MFAEMKLSDFLEKIAAKTPTPGGGSVSASVGALGAALGVMTARYSEVPEAESILDEIKKEFLILVDADAEAYGQVNSAMSLPKDSDDTKRRRKEALQIALGEASEIPLKGMLLAARGLKALAELAPKCNKHLASDLSAAATFLESALTGCGENVRVNAIALTDKVRRGRLEKELARLLDEGKSVREQVRRGVELLYVGK
ncbi:MAG TPA: cyclodeaminase/cyclohydrolase family protein [Planctomycetota bacterium]|nr:cyclodeaminase/cyclohydrolase family protein [Planctomycetota bacterium]